VLGEVEFFLDGHAPYAAFVESLRKR